MNTNSEKQQACDQNSYTITKADLPLSCPMPNQQLWNAHPQVYLSLSPNNTAKCPYCGALYKLQD